MPTASPLLLALGETIREVRDTRRLSQEALGLEIGVHRNYLGGIERGERKPSLETVTRIAAGLDMKASDLLALAEVRAERGTQPGTT